MPVTESKVVNRILYFPLMKFNKQRSFDIAEKASHLTLRAWSQCGKFSIIILIIDNRPQSATIVRETAADYRL